MTKFQMPDMGWLHLLIAQKSSKMINPSLPAVKIPVIYSVRSNFSFLPIRKSWWACRNKKPAETWIWYVWVFWIHASVGKRLNGNRKFIPVYTLYQLCAKGRSWRNVQASCAQTKRRMYSHLKAFSVGCILIFSTYPQGDRLLILNCPKLLLNLFRSYSPIFPKYNAWSWWA